MKRALLALGFAALAAPVFAQAPGATQIEVEAKPLIDAYIALFNKGDAAGLAKDVYVSADTAAQDATFKALRADSFGKLDVYSAAFCAVDGEHGKAILKFARIYTFGGKMNEDEAKVFDLVKAPAGWRIGEEADAPFETALSC